MIYSAYPKSFLILCTSTFKFVWAGAILASYLRASRVSCGSILPFCFVFFALGYGKLRAIRAHYIATKKSAACDKIRKWKTAFTREQKARTALSAVAWGWVVHARHQSRKFTSAWAITSRSCLSWKCHIKSDCLNDTLRIRFTSGSMRIQRTGESELKKWENI